MLFASGSASGGGPVDPPDEGGGGGSAYPATDDVVLLSMRPTGRRIASLTVDTSLAITSTNKHTISAAMDAAKNLQTANAQGSAVAFIGSIGPDYRVDIFIAPGTYTEEVGTGGWINLIGTGADPSEVVLTSAVTGGGTLHSYGPLYMENMTVVAQDNGGGSTSGPKYCWHLTIGGATTIAANCVFLNENSGSPAALGMDGGSGSYVLFYDCTIIGQAPPTITNMHGELNPTAPVTILWVDCTVNGNLGYSALDDYDVVDEMWVINTFNGGVPATPVSSGNVTVHTSGAWPVPVGGLSASDADYYLPSSVGTVHIETIGGGDQAAFSPPVGRIYYVPLAVASAINVFYSGIIAASAGGEVGVRPQLRQYGETGPEDADIGSLGTLVSGVNETLFYYRFTYYPGDAARDIAYMAVEIISGTPSLMGSLTAAVGAYYSDDGGTTILPVSAGRVPVVRLRSV